MSIDKATFSFSRYGVTLEPVRQEHIEMVRQWRNTPRIRELMLTTGEISAEQQQAWFNKMWSDPSQLYLLIYFKGQPIGVASLTAIDAEAGSCEPGMYIYDETYQGNIIPFSAAFALNDIAFEVLGLSRLHGKIFESNQASMRFHKACGYQIIGQDGELVRLALAPHEYLPARDRLKRFMRFEGQTNEQ